MIMRLSLFLAFVLSLSALGCGSSYSSYRLPVDSPVDPYRKPDAAEFENQEAPPPASDEAAPTYDEDLLNEEVPAGEGEGE
jgi:hypothetical protein